MKTTTTKTAVKKNSLLDKIRAEQEVLKKKKESFGGGGKFEKIDWFKPEEGDNLVRLLPNGNPDELPYVKVAIHYISVKKKDGSIAKGVPVRCAKDLSGDDCPLCDAVSALYNGSDKDREKAKEMRAREAYLFNVVNFKDRKVQPYSAGITVYEEFLNYIGDVGPEVFDVEAGYNFRLTKKVDPRKPKNLGVKYSVRIDVKPTALPSKLRVLLDEAVDLNTLYAETDLELMNRYLKGIGFAVEETEDEDEEEYVPKKKAPLKAKAVVEEDEDEEEEEVPAPKAKAKAASAIKKAAVVEEDEEEEDEDDFNFDEDEEEEEAPKKKPLMSKKAAPAPAKKAKAIVEDDEDEDDLEEDLDEEFAALGMM